MLNRPSSLVGSYFPIMPEDIKAMAVRISHDLFSCCLLLLGLRVSLLFAGCWRVALLAFRADACLLLLLDCLGGCVSVDKATHLMACVFATTQVRVLGGRWYKCVNGHAYYVDQVRGN